MTYRELAGKIINLPFEQRELPVLIYDPHTDEVHSVECLSYDDKLNPKHPTIRID